MSRQSKTPFSFASSSHYQDGSVKSLLESCVIVLSFFNGIYSGLLSLLLIYDLVYLRRNNLMHSFGKGEAFSQEFNLLVQWVGTYSTYSFIVRQFAWPVMYMHVYIAYMFFVSSRGRKPITFLQKNFFWAIVGVLLISAITITLETMSYRNRLYLNPLTVEVLFSGMCVVYVVFAYVETCIILRRRMTSGSRGNRDTSNVVKARNSAIAKLLTILTCFIVVWVWVISNNIQYLEHGESVAVDMPSG